MTIHSIWLDYRPVRIGWVLGSQNSDLVSHAAELSNCIWGGKFNPIIPAYDQTLANDLIKVFGVDILHPLDESNTTKEFIDQHSKYLIQGRLDKGIFIPAEKFCRYADIYHPVKKIRQEKPESKPFAYYEWDELDPLKNILTLTFGKYPPADKTGIDYLSIYESLYPDHQTLVSDKPVSIDLSKNISPINFSCLYLIIRSRSNPWLNPGIFMGDLTIADDLVKFWNFRAAGASLLFYDSNYHDRLMPLIESHVSLVKAHQKDSEKRFNVWSHAAYSGESDHLFWNYLITLNL